jgi:hypothetical protein
LPQSLVIIPYFLAELLHFCFQLPHSLLVLPLPLLRACSLLYDSG